MKTPDDVFTIVAFMESVSVVWLENSLESKSMPRFFSVWRIFAARGSSAVVSDGGTFTLHVGDVGEEKRSGIAATSTSHAWDHLDIVPNAVLEEICFRGVVINAVHNKITGRIDQRRQIVLRHQNSLYGDIYHWVELQDVVSHDFHFGFADIFSHSHGMTIERRDSHDIEIKKREVADTGASKHVSCVASNSS